MQELCGACPREFSEVRLVEWTCICQEPMICPFVQKDFDWGSLRFEHLLRILTLRRRHCPVRSAMMNLYRNFQAGDFLRLHRRRVKRYDRIYFTRARSKQHSQTPSRAEPDHSNPAGMHERLCPQVA